MQNKLKLLTQKLDPGLIKIISNVGWLSGEKFLTMALSLSIGVWMMRYLGSGDYGKLGICIGFVGLFEPVAKLGLDSIVIRNIVQDEEATPEILGTSFVLKLIGSSIVVAITFIAAKIFTGDPELAGMTVIIAASMMFTAFESIDYWFQSKVRSSAAVIARSTQLIISSLLKLIFIIFHFPLIAFVCLLLIDSILKASGFIWVYVREKQSIWQWDVKWSVAKDLMRDSWPLILSSVMVSVYMRIDMVMLGAMSTAQEAGNYAAAVRFSEIWYFIPIAICSSVFPSIIKARAQSKEKYLSKLQQLYDLMAWLSFSLVVVVTLTSQTVIPWLLGKEYEAASIILLVHIWSGPFVFLGVASHQWLMAENLSQFSFATTSMGAISNILLNLWLIPIHGGAGAALATAISYGISSHVGCLLSPQLFYNGWMLTKALFVPLRFHRNLIYVNQLKKMFF
jgi:O-antigen/teichoic acid export membrane protein